MSRRLVISGALCRMGKLKPSQFSRLIDCVETPHPLPSGKIALSPIFRGEKGGCTQASGLMAVYQNKQRKETLVQRQTVVVAVICYIRIDRWYL